MDKRLRGIVIGGAAIVIVGGFCFFSGIPPFGPPGLAATPTATLPKPSLTPTKLSSRQTPTPTLTPQSISPNATAPLPIPSPFDMTMQFTNGSCGTGTPSYTYTFTIDGTSLTLEQTDAGITSTGTFDQATGAFSTSADVGTGDESYAGTISFDGTTISVTGSYGYTPNGGATCTFSIAGTTTP